MAKVIAHVSGIALKPGTSRNRRLYTRGAIARMVGRAQERIEAGGSLNIVDRSKASEPLTQLTHHETTNSTHIVGRIVGLSLDEQGNARFDADIADTPHGRTIAALLDTTDGNPPFLKNVSIRGEWLGEVKQVLGEDGEPAVSGADVILHGLDYVSSPGVPGAGVDSFQWAVGVSRPGEADDSRGLIYESVTEVRVTSLTEETTPAAPGAGEGFLAGLRAQPPAALAEDGGLREAMRGVLALDRAHLLDNGACVTCARVGEAAKDPDKPYGDVTYADTGYQKDGKKRYPLDTVAHAKSAWSYINQAKNAAFYSAAQLKRVKGRIVKALKAFGVKVAAEGWAIEPAYQVTEAVAEFYGEDPVTAGSWCVKASNGPVNINLSSYCMDPADLDVILRAAADAACKALAALDPDMDGDVDVPGAGPNSNNVHAPGEATPKTPAANGSGADWLARLGTESTTADGDPDPVTEAAPVTDPAPETVAEPEENADIDEEPAVSEPTTTETAAAQAPAATETIPAPPATPTTEAALTPTGITLSPEMFESLLNRIVNPPAPAAAAAPAPAAAPVITVTATETAPPASAAATATETAPAAPAAVTESDEQETARLVAEGVAAALRAEGYQVPGITETKDQMIQRLIGEKVTTLKQQLVASGAVPVQRAGLNPEGEVNEHRQPAVVTGTGPGEGLNSHGLPLSWPDKPLHQFTSEELGQYTGPVLDHHVMGRKAVTDLA